MKNLENGTEFIWPKEKFLNRLYLMKEMYNNYEEEEEDWDFIIIYRRVHEWISIMKWSNIRYRLIELLSWTSSPRTSRIKLTRSRTQHQPTTMADITDVMLLTHSYLLVLGRRPHDVPVSKEQKIPQEKYNHPLRRFMEILYMEEEEEEDRRGGKKKSLLQMFRVTGGILNKNNHSSCVAVVF